MACLLPLVVEEGPNTNGTPSFLTLIGLAASDSTQEEDSGRLLLHIPYLIFFQLIKRIENKNSSHLPFLHFITVNGKNSHPLNVFPFQ